MHLLTACYNISPDFIRTLAIYPYIVTCHIYIISPTCNPNPNPGNTYVQYGFVTIVACLPFVIVFVGHLFRY